MKKNYLAVLCLLCMFVFTYCSTDKDYSINKPSDESIHKPSDSLDEDDGFTLFSKNHVPDSDSYIEGQILQNQSDNPKFKLSNRKWQGIPSIGKDRLGNFYVAWISGGEGESNENYLTVSLSRDNGRTWSHDKLVLAVNTDDVTRMKDPNFFNDKFGNLYLVWGKEVQKKAVAEKEWAVTWYSKINLSKDGNKIYYSPPRRIAEGIMMNKPIYSKPSDEILFPIANWYLNKGDPKMHQAFIYKANYGVGYLKDFTNVGYIPLDTNLMYIYEHMIVQLDDNTYYGMVRTWDGIYYSKSIDGSTWQKGKKFSDLGPTAASRFYLGKLSSGRLILIFNNSKIRAKLTICISEDDGVTWPYKMLIDDSSDIKFGISYPDMVETEKGILNIVYDNMRSPIGDINFVQIKEEDIINNNQAPFFKLKISSLQ